MSALEDYKRVVGEVVLQRENYIIGGDLATNGTASYQISESGTCSTNGYMSDLIKYIGNVFTTAPTWARTANGLTITSNEASTTTSAFGGYHYSIEGYDSTKLFSNSHFTLSGKVLVTGVSGKVYVALRSSAYDYSYVFPVTVSAGVPLEFNESIPIPTGGTFGTGANVSMYLSVFGTQNVAANHTTTFNAWQAGNFSSGSDNIDLFAVNGATISIDKLKIESGQAFTGFWSPTYEEELNRTNRYFEVREYGSTRVAVLAATTVGAAEGLIDYKHKRTTPSVTYSGTGWNLSGIATESLNVLSFNPATSSTTVNWSDNGSPFTVGNAHPLLAAGADGKIIIDARY